MRAITQKIKTWSVASLLIAASIALPVVLSQPTFAAPTTAGKTQPNGTCFYNGPDTASSGTKIEPCKGIITTSQTDKDGNRVSYDNCYEVDATTSTETITKVNCDGSAVGGTDTTQYCGVSNSGSPVPCETATDNAATSSRCSSASNCDLVTKYVKPLIEFLSALVGVAVIISVVIGGIQYGASAGDPQAASAAKNRIRNALLALVVFLFLFALLNFLIPGGLL